MIKATNTQDAAVEAFKDALLALAQGWRASAKRRSKAGAGRETCNNLADEIEGIALTSQDKTVTQLRDKTVELAYAWAAYAHALSGLVRDYEAMSPLLQKALVGPPHADTATRADLYRIGAGELLDASRAEA